MDQPIIHDSPPPIVHDTPPPTNGPVVHTDAPPLSGNSLYDTARKYASMYNVPYGIVRGVMFRESSNNPNVRDTPGGEPGVSDVGLMQVGTDLGHKYGLDLRMPEQNIHAGVRYLHELFQRFGSWPTAISAYNTGPGNIKGNSVAPYTADYVASILNYASAVNTGLGQTHAAVQAAAQHPKARQRYQEVANQMLAAMVPPSNPGLYHNANAPSAFNVPGTVQQADAATGTRLGGTMQRVNTVGEIAPEIGNAFARDLQAPAGSPGTDALNHTLFNPQLTITQKLDAAYQELGINSPGELSYWAKQPGVREAILSARPITPGGQLLQMAFGLHADLARFKPSHPFMTGAETFGLELYNPTLSFVSRGAGILARSMANGSGRFAEAAIAGARARTAAEAGENIGETYDWNLEKSGLPAHPEMKRPTPLYDEFVRTGKPPRPQGVEQPKALGTPPVADAGPEGRATPDNWWEQEHLGRTISTQWRTYRGPGEPIAVGRYFSKPNTGTGSKLRGGTSYFATRSGASRNMRHTYYTHSDASSVGEGGSSYIEGFVRPKNPLFVQQSSMSTAAMSAAVRLRKLGLISHQDYADILGASDDGFKTVMRRHGFDEATINHYLQRGHGLGFEAIANKLAAANGFDSIIAHDDNGFIGEIVMLGDHELYDNPYDIGSKLAADKPQPPKRGPKYPVPIELQHAPVTPQDLQPEVDHPSAPSPNGIAYGVGHAFGWKFHKLVSHLGPAYERLSKATQGLPIIGDRYLGYAKVYGPLGEHQAAMFVTRHGSIRATNEQNIISPEMYGNLNSADRIRLNQTVNNLPQFLTGQTVVEPDMIIPRSGGSLMDRAMKISDKNLAQWHSLRQLDPVTAARWVQPQTLIVPHGLEKALGEPEWLMRVKPQNNFVDGRQVFGRPITVMAYAPQLSLHAGQSWFRSLASKVGLGSTPNVVRRIVPFNVAIQRGLSKMFNPAGDMVVRWNGTDHYIEMLRQLLRDGLTTFVPHLGVPATLKIKYEWPGGNEYAGRFAQAADGSQLDLTQPILFGDGQLGHDAYKDFEDRLYQHVGQVRIGKTFNPATDEASARAMTHDEVVREWATQHPEHNINAAREVNSPALRGYAVENTYLDQVKDANPRIRSAIGGFYGRTPTEPDIDFARIIHADLLKNGVKNDKLDIEHLSSEEMARAHFTSSYEDEAQHNFLMGYDVFNAGTRMAALTGFAYHPMFNTYPAMLSLLLKHAGQNPYRILKWGGGLSRVMGAGWYKVADNLDRGVAEIQNKVLNSTGLGAKVSGGLPSLPTWMDINPEWLARIQRLGLAQHAVSNYGLSSPDFVRIMSLPAKELPVSQRMMRAMVNAGEINKKLVFDIQEASMMAYAHHVLTDELGMDEGLAARAVARSISDYTNLVGVERSAAYRRLIWFGPFMRNMLRFGASMMMQAPQIPVGAFHAIQNIDQTMGDPNPPDLQLDLRKQPNGGFRRVPIGAAALRYAYEITELFGMLTGDERGAGKAAFRLGTSNLSPLPSLAARGYAQAYNMSKGNGVTPQPWDLGTGLWDVQQPGTRQLQEAAQTVGGKFVPFGMLPNTFDSMPGKEYAQVKAASENVRRAMNHLAKIGGDPRIINAGADLVYRLDNGDETALRAAKAYAALHGGGLTFTSKPKSGGFGSGFGRF